MAGPAPAREAGPGEGKPPDPEGRIFRGTEGLVLAEVTVVPARGKPGGAVRVHLRLHPNEASQAHWNNEAEPLRVWADLPPGWQAQAQLPVAPQND
jgi:hypothetical protein